ncbi:MAG: dihydroxyacetone kinase phosphoryl donor subunit DhaM [Lactobacillus iners]|jgi:dihydroxyacetone kinase, phosphotransfer subunit|uniref:phosphoenolpyruvate--glycerone phosphotransferase n=2 Tax=Lactobacillus iners TaxID=147802 RepID=C8PCR9_9LACO|nr:dihydroxyacetone kinase phosphoryl donor subunit DhaM [Lactobacillus iners]EFO66688.1 dihydroxyacetone kinase, phosphotransfer subunit [Lactobacillus iners LactinV 11V1-d]EFO69971.1 dihydroxyacetone kinase, phosphotransfer subunit [Lactobacillus iners LactinV 01V1-a]EEW51727.1 dihydroxyacetone kinase, phosphotransfer subunit [Lactobacillus iners DSM 13335]EFQ51974.1 dihydroxyacetone kinase, phosphotransfer subunit [Lactobacillus iners LEAF 3008A-a]EFU79131.1 dihydroxyacetone kinase, phospho
MSLGITLVSHSPKIVAGLSDLLSQVAKDVSITIAGGTEQNDIGTSMDKIMTAFEENKADEILAFYDLGSAKMNLEMAQEFASKKVHLYDVAFIEGAYTAATLLQAGVDLSTIEAQLAPLKIK